MISFLKEKLNISKITPAIGGIFLFFFIIFFSLLYLLFFNSVKPSELKIIKVAPEQSAILNVGQSQNFIVTFNRSVDLKEINISLTKTDITKGVSPSQNEELNESTSIHQNQLLITLIEAILPYHQYNLKISDKNTSNVLADIKYLSSTPPLPTLQNNNLTLSQYLPYETSSFRLTYLASRNIYIFNFKYDPRSSKALQDQYDKAKAEATDFIKSKGIDPSTITIEWRYS